jgi:hypothetical protein
MCFARVREWRRKRMLCPVCGERMSKVIYAGLPGKICGSCTIFMGMASYAAMAAFTGHMMVYEGSYWVALWHWLFDDKE